VNPDLARWRADTPGCLNRIHFNNAGASLMPSPVRAAIDTHIALESAIGGYEAADLRAAEVEQVYRDVASLVGAGPQNIAIGGSATAAFSQCLSTIDFSPGDVIITSRCDYTSYQIQYLALARRLGVLVLHAADLPEGGIDPASVRELLSTPRVRLVSVSWVPTNSGLVQDVAGVGAVCAAAGVLCHVDACQAVGQIPIDVDALQCDYLSATGRKFLRGPRGIGFLYASDRAMARGDFPLIIGMRGATWSARDQFALAPTARRFEVDEFPYALVLGLGAAASYANAVGVAEAGRLAFELAGRLRAGLAGIPGVRVLDRGRAPCAIVTADVAGHDGPEIKAHLAAHGVNCTVSLRWYGQYDFGEKGVDGAIRLSPHYFNTVEEVDRVVELIASLAGGDPASK
jgi:selenocysteine lyase/cysteine desulfurase